MDPEILDKRIEKLITHFEEEEQKEQSKKKQQSIVNLWCIPSMLKICLILYLCWFTNHLIGYSAVFNATNFGSLYVSMTAITTASFIANTMLYLIIERLRRRTLSRVAYCFIIFACFSLAVSFYIEDQEKARDLAALSSSGSTGITHVLSDEEAREQALHMDRLNAIYVKYNIDLRNISTAAIKAVKPKDEGNWRLWLGMILKYSVSTCYHTIYVLSVESFPTIIRQLSVGTCSVASRFASILSPFTKELVGSFEAIIEVIPVADPFLPAVGRNGKIVHLRPLHGARTVLFFGHLLHSGDARQRDSGHVRRLSEANRGGEWQQKGKEKADRRKER